MERIIRDLIDCIEERTVIPTGTVRRTVTARGTLLQADSSGGASDGIEGNGSGMLFVGEWNKSNLYSPQQVVTVSRGDGSGLWVVKPGGDPTVGLAPVEDRDNWRNLGVPRVDDTGSGVMIIDADDIAPHIMTVKEIYVCDPNTGTTRKSKIIMSDLYD